MERRCSWPVVVGLALWLACFVWGTVLGWPAGHGLVLVHQTTVDPPLSQETQARWSSWLSDSRVPVFWFWRDPASGKWVAVCHIVPRTWSPQYLSWSESATGLEAVLVKILDKLDGVDQWD